MTLLLWNNTYKKLAAACSEELPLQHRVSRLLLLSRFISVIIIVPPRRRLACSNHRSFCKPVCSAVLGNAVCVSHRAHRHCTGKCEVWNFIVHRIGKVLLCTLPNKILPFWSPYRFLTLHTHKSWIIWRSSKTKLRRKLRPANGSFMTRLLRGRAEEARYVAAWYQNAQWQIEMRVPLRQQGLLQLLACLIHLMDQRFLLQYSNWTKGFAGVWIENYDFHLQLFLMRHDFFQISICALLLQILVSCILCAYHFGTSFNHSVCTQDFKCEHTFLWMCSNISFPFKILLFYSIIVIHDWRSFNIFMIYADIYKIARFRVW